MLSRRFEAPAGAALLRCSNPLLRKSAVPLPLSQRSVCVSFRKEAGQGPSEGTSSPVDSPRLNLVDMLLGGAASRILRGTCTCIHCKGKGREPCSGCNGGGIVDPGHGSARSVRNMLDLLNSNAKPSGQQWLQTNRCRRCHGLGHFVCVNCKGSGHRFKAGPDDACLLPEA